MWNRKWELSSSWLEISENEFHFCAVQGHWNPNRFVSDSHSWICNRCVRIWGLHNEWNWKNSHFPRHNLRSSYTCKHGHSQAHKSWKTSQASLIRAANLARIAIPKDSHRTWKHFEQWQQSESRHIFFIVLGRRHCYSCSTLEIGSTCLHIPANVTEGWLTVPCKYYCTIWRQQYQYTPGKSNWYFNHCSLYTVVVTPQ